MKLRLCLAMFFVLFLARCGDSHSADSPVSVAGKSGGASGRAGADAGRMSKPDRMTSPGNRLPPKALISGACDVLRLAGDPTECKGLDELTQCEAEQCGLDACAEICEEHISCAVARDDHCAGTETCPRTPECHECMTQLLLCAFITSCQGLYSCGSGDEGGACEKLEACCNNQSNPDGCLGWTQSMGRLSGDEGCEMLIDDAKFLEAYASDPPCDDLK